MILPGETKVLGEKQLRKVFLWNYQQGMKRKRQQIILACARMGTFITNQCHQIRVCQRCHPLRTSLAIRNQHVSCNFSPQPSMDHHSVPCEQTQTCTVPQDFWLILTQLLVRGDTSKHNHTNGYTTDTQPVLPAHHSGCYVGVPDLQPGLRKLAYRGRRVH